MTIVLSWKHQGARPEAFAPLVPKALQAIDRWGETVGKMAEDEFGVFYWVKTRDGIKSPDGGSKLRILRPATLRLGTQSALKDAPDHWVGHTESLARIFVNLMECQGRDEMHRPTEWTLEALDFMVQLAWFREVWFA